MTLIRCTQKLRKEMGLKPADLCESADDSLLGAWYAHLFFEERKKCVLFVSEKTLLCFLAPALSRDRIRKLDEVFRDGLFRLLLDEGFQPDHATPVFNECRTIRYAATADRSMTGTVNEMVKDIQFMLPDFGGVATPNLPALHHRLNRNPLKRNEYQYAIERTKQVLDSLSAR
ncbi:MAG: hypothetical protein MPJ50_12050 [Pirellulales bacterium]|nr:hypothetical protein [Pirellulales bacterium]